MSFQTVTLDNGLSIVGEINSSARSMAASYLVRTGARDETPEISGVSHFLEHMMFKGSDRRSAEQVNLEFDEMGADNNAFTSEEATVFYGSVLPEFQTRLLDLLTDMMRPSLRDEDFNVEKNVILEEIALYEDQPRFLALDKVRSIFHSGHPLGNSVLGTQASISALQRDQMYDYFRRRYASDNLSLVLTGAVDWGRAVDQVRDLTKSWTPGGATRELSQPTAEPHVTILPSDKFNRGHLAFAAPGVSAQDPRRDAADVIATALGASRGSRLYWALVEPGLADAAWVDHSEEDGTGTFYAYASCEPDRAQEVADKVRQVLKEAAESGLQPDEVARAKRKLASGRVLRGETPMGRLITIGFDWQYRHELETLDQAVDTLLQVDVAACNALLKDHAFSPLTVVALGPITELH